MQEYSDGSRREGAAGATRIQALYLGRYATVMDTALMGMTLGWEEGHRVVALDSQGAIVRAEQLAFEPHGRGSSNDCRRHSERAPHAHAGPGAQRGSWRRGSRPESGERGT